MTTGLLPPLLGDPDCALSFQLWPWPALPMQTSGDDQGMGGIPLAPYRLSIFF